MGAMKGGMRKMGQLTGKQGERPTQGKEWGRIYH